MRITGTIQYGLLAVVGCLTMGAIYARSTLVDLGAHHEYDHNIQTLETLDTRLNEDVLKIRYGLLGSYDSLVEDQRALERVERLLLQPPHFLEEDAQAGLRSAVEQYTMEADEKSALVERFKSANAALKGSIRYFPIVGHQLLEHAPPPLVEPVRSLLDAVLLYQVSGSHNDRESALAQLGRVAALDLPLESAHRTLLASTLAHARNVLARRADLDQLIVRVESSSTRQRIAQLAERYQAAYVSVHRRADQFRWLLFLLGSITVAGTVLALRALARAKWELEKTNASLDRRVRSRTAELSEAKALLECDGERLRKLNEALEISNRELDDFAYIASHDLKEPLRGIHNYAAFLIEDYDDKLDAEGRHKLETLGRLAHRMDGLIETLLHFSRVGRTELACGLASIQEIVEDVVDSLHISLEEKHVEVRIPEVLPTIYCDRVRVTEVFRNLISNALKYNDKPEKWIEIGFARDSNESDPSKDHVTFRVSDNGIGIREQHLESVFRIFKRLHGRDKFGGGTGAGLTIVKKIVERHGGRIWIESRHGEGTTFHFDLGGMEHA